MKDTSSFSLRRRQVLIAGGGGVSSAFAGCGIPFEDNPNIQITIELREVAERSDTQAGFDLTMSVDLGFSTKPSIDDVLLLGYDKDGNRVARHQIDTLGMNKPAVEVTTASSGFPAIVTASADISACDELIIEIVYLKGPVTPASSRTWEDTFRNCGDDLPPERLLDGDPSTSQTGN